MSSRSQRAAESLGSAGRRRLFLAVTLLAPVLLLVLLELGLRALGVGGSQPLFVEPPGLPGSLHASPDVMRRYFVAAGDAAATIEPILFKKQKPVGGFRIVVQGGSSAAGFPYGRWGGLAGMLGDRLEAAFPDREIEVITTAMAAVNSYALLDLVDEIIEIEPDAVLIYAGHNEYLGVLGVASALTPVRSRAATLLHLRLRRSGIYQLVHRIVDLVRGALRPAADVDRRSLFASAAKGALVPYGSALYDAGVRQLEANLTEILERYRDAGIPVYIGTLVSNEKDVEPFESAPDPGVDRETWEQGWQDFQERSRARDVPGARDALARLLELDADAADTWFALARLEQRAGRPEVAREAYRNARDRDQLRFRAPEAFNRVIREQALRQGATVVEVQRHFAEASPEGIVGEELLLEHVHPTADGYFLLADAYYEALERDGRIGDFSGAPSLEQARRDMPITAIDRILADYDTRELRAGFPFSDPPRRVSLPPAASEIERLAERRRTGELDWLHAMEGLLQIYRREGRSFEAARVARLVAQAHPGDRAPNLRAGLLYLQLEQPARARRYLERSLLAQPDDALALQALIQADLRLGDEELAYRHLLALERVDPRHPLLRELSRLPGLGSVTRRGSAD